METNSTGACAWQHFAYNLGLAEDLLPAVGTLNPPLRPGSPINPAMLGKMPGFIGASGFVTPMRGWPDRKTTRAEIEAWSADSRHSVAVIGRKVKLLDIDVDDATLAAHIVDLVRGVLGVGLPVRGRQNSGKRALLFKLPGELGKRSFKLRDGAGLVELLGHRQQFLLAGMHTSGVVYEWEGGLPTEVPALTLQQLDALWALLIANYAQPGSETNSVAG
ncbi:MAG: bifunctional DNA primase/polymerase, partial [Shewanella sp.]